jgi:hypothetical protein
MLTVVLADMLVATSDNARALTYFNFSFVSFSSISHESARSRRAIDSDDLLEYVSPPWS